MKKARVVRKGPKTAHRLEGGPWKSHTLFLDSTGDGNTALLAIGPVVGRYAQGKWEPAPSGRKEGLDG